MKKNQTFSFWAVWLITGLYIFLFFNTRDWTKRDALRHDMMPYYSYLPAVFIDQDITLNSDSARKNYFYSWSVETTARPGRIVRMTMGVSIMQLPFFLLAHITAEPLGHKANGFNPHYFFLILAGCVFYAMTALWLLRWLLSKYFNDRIVALTLIFIACATNLLYYTVYEGAMSHVYTFFLVSAVLALTVKWHQQPKLITAILLGLAIGIIILVRPVNGLILLVPLLYNVYSKSSFITKLELIKKNYVHFIVAAIALFLAVLPQPLYWKYMSGHYYFYAYGKEKLLFNHPHIINGLFSYRKGWLLYTPVMSFALIGFLFISRYIKQWAAAVFVLTPLFIYVVYSWWTWWYGGGFGSRPMIDIYPVLALPMAAAIAWAYKNRITFSGLVLVGAFFVYLNGFQTWQYKKSIIHWDSMTKEAYWTVFLKDKSPENYDSLLKTPDYEKAIKGEEEY